MHRQYGLVLLLIVFVSAVCHANCYVFQNNTDVTQSLNFTYSKPLPGARAVIAIPPHSAFPTKHAWCWNTPEKDYAIVTITPGNFQPSWAGQLVLGNGRSAAPSGTYSLNATKASTK